MAHAARVIGSVLRSREVSTVRNCSQFSVGMAMASFRAPTAPAKTESFVSTNIEHRARFWTKPVKPSYGTTNIFNDEGTGLAKDVWNANAVDTWSDWSFDTPVFIEDSLADTLSSPPDKAPNPAKVNEPVCSGFQALEWLGIAEWRFQYCTTPLE